MLNPYHLSRPPSSTPIIYPLPQPLSSTPPHPQPLSSTPTQPLSSTPPPSSTPIIYPLPIFNPYHLPLPILNPYHLPPPHPQPPIIYPPPLPQPLSSTPSPSSTPINLPPPHPQPLSSTPIIYPHPILNPYHLPPPHPQPLSSTPYHNPYHLPPTPSSTPIIYPCPYHLPQPLSSTPFPSSTPIIYPYHLPPYLNPYHLPLSSTPTSIRVYKRREHNRAWTYRGTDHLSNVPHLRDPSHLTNLSIRDPSQLVVGAPNTTPSNWRHHPNTLVTASVQYVAQYLGSTHVKELQGTDSTMRSIQKLRKAQLDIGKAPRIVLSVSYRGVRFMDAVNLDADDLSHFAYITKDLQTKGHYCHVFRVQSRDLATEIILTLGEAFEVAYQLALREQPYTTCNQSDEQKLAIGHTRSKSEHLRGTRSLSNGSAHTRSHSTVPQQVSIGGVSSSSAENLLSDSGNGSEKECGSRRDSLSSITPGHTNTQTHTQMNGS
ncbi:hypothetical protein Pcinc_039341 [Petrolisthes cinctipes]|uniref:PID domain-containing protein n=1 Tax=Petrolisthes cinctipes TaxID=88211 RepID=A0AAE1EKN9_PETCI|nr:hypothetical protein Pcinc_039341 [Petrolisthes cinctipes]